MAVKSYKLTWNYQHITIFLPIVTPMASSAISYGEPWGLLADLLIFLLILIKLGHGIPLGLLLQSLRKFGDREPGYSAYYVFF